MVFSSPFSSIPPLYYIFNFPFTLLHCTVLHSNVTTQTQPYGNSITNLYYHTLHDAHVRSLVPLGMYSLPSHLSQSSRDLILRMLVVDPMKRITIPGKYCHICTRTQACIGTYPLMERRRNTYLSFCNFLIWSLLSRTLFLQPYYYSPHL